MKKGIGYNAYVTHMLGGEVREKAGQERYVIYFGKSWIPHEGKWIPSDYLKIGRAKFSTPIMRKVNTHGSEFRFLSEIVFKCDDDTWKAEKIAAQLFKKIHAPGDENQKELYLASHTKVPSMVETLLEQVKAAGIKPIEMSVFKTDDKMETKVLNSIPSLLEQWLEEV